MKKVKVCRRCSGFDVRELKELKEYSKQINCKLKTDCIGGCRRKHPELTDKYCGWIDDIFVVCNTKQEFIEKIKETESL